jgi:hypothetical protein
MGPGQWLSQQPFRKTGFQHGPLATNAENKIAVDFRLKLTVQGLSSFTGLQGKHRSVHTWDNAVVITHASLGGLKQAPMDYE